MKGLCRVLAITTLCTSAPIAAGNPSALTPVRVEVLRHMITEHVREPEEREWVLFVGIGDQRERRNGPVSDAPNDVLRPIRALGWNAQPASHATPFDKRTGVRDTRTGRRGLWFYIGQVNWAGSAEAMVYGEFLRDGKSGEGVSYRVVHKADGWKVVSRQSTWKA